MKITIGQTNRLSSPPKKKLQGKNAFCHGKILNIRSPRRRGNKQSTVAVNRRKKEATDPMGGRVVTMYIRDASQIPDNLQSGEYTIAVRFIPKKQT